MAVDGLSPTTGRAFARVGLLGNPSDGYGGKALAFALADFHARAEIRPCHRVEIADGRGEHTAFASLLEAADAHAVDGADGGLRLVSAALHRFLRHAPSLAPLDARDPKSSFSIRFTTGIPRQVGLAGSSAIVIAVMKSLIEWFDHPVECPELAEMALAAEVEELGLAGGAMDRVIQVYDGVVAMDLREPRTAASYRRVDPALLPPLFVAWEPTGGEPSGKAHGDLRARWNRGDERLRAVMLEFRSIVDAGLDALERADHAVFRELVDRNFELRAGFFPISARDRQAITIARSHGAAAKLCGSGGAIVGQPADEADLGTLEAAYGAAGFGFLRPRVALPERAGSL